jgi:hypothetical protein
MVFWYFFRVATMAADGKSSCKKNRTPDPNEPTDPYILSWSWISVHGYLDLNTRSSANNYVFKKLP